MYNSSNDRLSKLIRWRGSLIFYPGHEDTLFIQFLASVFGLPFAWTKSGRFLILGVSEIDLPKSLQFGSVAEQIGIHQIAEELALGELSFLPCSDLVRIAEDIATERLTRLNKTEKVYLALRHLGKPAHFSEVAETYNSLFPDDQMPERNVHAVLSRCAQPNNEQHGIVWIGVRGTYALKEHGYKRPDMGIHDTVATIVEEKYQATRKPVHITIIAAELGKYRHAVHPASLAFSTGVNPRLDQASKDYFIPKNPEQETHPTDGASDLDRILREFREEHSGNS